MSTKLNREAYQELIRGDMKALELLPHSLERAHIEHVLYWSIRALYPEWSEPNRSEYGEKQITPALEVTGPNPPAPRVPRWANWREVLTHYWRHDRPLWLEALTITLAAGAIVGLVFLVWK